MSMSSEQMGAIMGALGKMDFSKLKQVAEIDSMDVYWKQEDADDGSVIKINIETTPVNPQFGETFLEMLKLVAGEKVSITKL